MYCNPNRNENILYVNAAYHWVLGGIIAADSAHFRLELESLFRGGNARNRAAPWTPAGPCDRMIQVLSGFAVGSFTPPAESEACSMCVFQLCVCVRESVLRLLVIYIIHWDAVMDCAAASESEIWGHLRDTIKVSRHRRTSASCSQNHLVDVS